MSKVRGKDTKPELALRMVLWREGLRFRTNVRDIPGRPDIAVKSRRLAVFVDGCFWHGCPVHYREPRTRVAFWREKLRRNEETRRRVLVELAGWKVFQFFECEIMVDPEAAARRVVQELLIHDFRVFPSSNL